MRQVLGHLSARMLGVRGGDRESSGKGHRGQEPGKMEERARRSGAHAGGAKRVGCLEDGQRREKNESQNLVKRLIRCIRGLEAL